MLLARIPFKWLEFLKVEYPRRCNWCKTKVRVHVQYVSSWWCKGFFKLFLKIKIYWEFYEVKFIEREKSLNVELDIYKCRVSLGKTFWLRLPPCLVISQTGHHPTINWIKNLKKVVSFAWMLTQGPLQRDLVYWELIQGEQIAFYFYFDFIFLEGIFWTLP